MIEKTNEENTRKQCLPSRNQTWLAGKSPINGGFQLGQSSINGLVNLQQAMLDDRRRVSVGAFGYLGILDVPSQTHSADDPTY